MARSTSGLALLMLVLTACGGGGGGSEGDPELALLEGRWFGPVLGLRRSLEVRFDDSGRITQMLEDGTPTGQTGFVAHQSGTYYEGELSGLGAIRLFLDPQRRHAALFGAFPVACLERDATALPPAGFAVADVAPAAWSGLNLVLDDQVRVSAAFVASATISVDGSYAGSDATGLDFGSPVGTGLESFEGVLRGDYADNVNPTTGFIEILPSPDETFLVAVSFPELNTTLLNAQFVGVWNRD